jgi:hypothetical protein
VWFASDVGGLDSCAAAGTAIDKLTFQSRVLFSTKDFPRHHNPPALYPFSTGIILIAAKSCGRQSISAHHARPL